MYDQFMKGFQSFQMPQFDASRAVSMQQRNIEIASQTAQMFQEFAQGYAQKASEYSQQLTEQSVNAARDIYTTPTPDQNFARQGDYISKTLRSLGKQSKEMAKMTADSQSKLFDTFSKQIEQNIDDSREFFKFSNVA